MLNSSKAEIGYDNKNTPLDIKVRPAFTGEPLIERAPLKWNSFSNASSVTGAIIANRLLASLPEGDLTRLLPHLQSVPLISSHVIYQPFGASDYLYFPENAVLSQLNILEDGRTVETAMIGKDGVVGLSSILCLQPTAFWTQTLISGNAWRINAAVFKQEFARGGFLQAAVLNYISYYIAQISQRAICNNHHRIEERFSTWLLMITDRIGKNNLTLTHSQISHLLGVHRPSITCIAQDLREKGIIDYVRGRIIIINRDKLEQSACECYSAVTLNGNLV